MKVVVHGSSMGNAVTQLIWIAKVGMHKFCLASEMHPSISELGAEIQTGGRLLWIK